jgi:hypothetical protein
LQTYSADPNSVSRLFGQLVGVRHFSSGCDWAMAGAAIRDPERVGLEQRRRRAELIHRMSSIMHG